MNVLEMTVQFETYGSNDAEPADQNRHYKI